MNTPANRTAEDLARAYLTALQAKDRPAIMALLADGFALELPLNCPGTNDFSESWRGLQTASDGWDWAFQTIEVLKFSKLEFWSATNPNIAFAEGLGDMKMTNGRSYKNRYLILFEVENGKIKRLREFTNPVTAALAWGLELPVPEPA